MKSGTYPCGRQSEDCGFTVSPVKPQNISSRQPLCLCGEQIVFALLLFSLLFLSCPAHAQTRIEVTPMITVSEIYDDNIFLTKNNTVSDYITIVTPGIDIGLRQEHTDFKLRYAPMFYMYADNNDLNFTGQSAALNFGQDLAQGLRFSLKDTYLKSGDPQADPQNIQGLRQTTQMYWTNITDVNLGYIFGAENQVNVGYIYNYYRNDQITLDDSDVQNPYANLTYWFDVKNGGELTYGYTDAKFTRDDNFPAASDYTSNAAGIRYLRRFNPNSTGYVGYNYAIFDYERVLPQDFNVHSGLVGLDHSFSPEYTVSASLGYFIRVNELTDNQDGPTYTASLIRNFDRGSITIGGNGGWSYENLQQGVGLTSGFSQYYGGYVNGRYEILERVNLYAGLSYRHDKYTIDKSDYWRGNCGVRWDFLRYFYVDLDYSYIDRSEEFGLNDYTGNRIMLSIGASKLYQW
jgi:hypothetical protein